MALPPPAPGGRHGPFGAKAFKGALVACAALVVGGLVMALGGGDADPIRWVRTYADAAPGALLALTGSSGLVEVALRDGSAAQHLRVARGAEVLLRQHG
jgi:S-adenosylmethionine hydrolase